MNSLLNHPLKWNPRINYLTKDTLLRLNLRVQGGVLGYDVEEVKVKVEKDVKTVGKRKREEELGYGVKQTVRKSQRPIEPRRNQVSGIMINLGEDPVPQGAASRAVDFPLLSTDGLHGILKEIQASIALLGTRVQGLEALIAHQDVQHDQLLQSINKGASNIRTKIDTVAASFFIYELL